MEAVDAGIAVAAAAAALETALAAEPGWELRLGKGLGCWERSQCSQGCPPVGDGRIEIEGRGR